MTIVDVVRALVADSPPVVRTLAWIALISGAIGLGLAIWHSTRYRAAARHVGRLGAWRSEARGSDAGGGSGGGGSDGAGSDGGGAGGKRFTGCLDALSLFDAGPAPQTMLSPDAVWELVTTRLHGDVESTRSLVRFFGYLPLLVGLAATMLGLAGLIDQIGLGMSAGVRASLRGVFLGTLAGIAGSAIVGFSGIFLAASARRMTMAVERYLHGSLLPAMPERRIGVQIEEAIIGVIAERTELVVAQFRDALQPIAAELSTAAIQSSKAATSATGAFDHAATILQGSGNLRAAATLIGDRLVAIERSAVSLAKAAQSTFDAAALAAKGHQALAGAASATIQRAQELADAGKAIEAGVEKLTVPLAAFTTTADGLATSTVRVGTELEGVRLAFGGLASSIESRNDLEKQRIDGLHAQLDSLNTPLSKLHAVLSAMTREVEATRGATEVFRQKAATSLADGIDQNFAKLASQLGDVLTPIAGLIPSAANELTLAARSVEQATADAKQRLPEVQTIVRPIQTSLAGYVADTQTLLAELRETNRLLTGAASRIATTLAPPAPAPAPPPVRPTADSDREQLSTELRAMVGQLREVVSVLRESQPQSRSQPAQQQQVSDDLRVSGHGVRGGDAHGLAGAETVHAPSPPQVAVKPRRRWWWFFRRKAARP
jgi:hypothetical protein